MLNNVGYMMYEDSLSEKTQSMGRGVDFIPGLNGLVRSVAVHIMRVIIKTLPINHLHTIGRSSQWCAAAGSLIQNMLFILNHMCLSSIDAKIRLTLFYTCVSLSE